MGSECGEVLEEMKERCQVRKGVGKNVRGVGGNCGKVWRDVSGEWGGVGEVLDECGNKCRVSVEGEV